MSLWGKIATTVVGAAVGKVFGGSGGNGDSGPRVDPVTGIDMANKLSAECGFPITQSQANYAKAAAGGDRRLACELLRPAGGIAATAPVATPPIRPTVMSGGSMVDASVLRTPALQPGGPSMSTAFGPAPFIGGVIGGMSSIGGAVARLGTIAGIVRGASGKILRVVLPTGRVVSRKNAVKLAKQVGIATAATVLGISAVDVAQMVLDESSTRRRRRGITARDLQNARRVACTVSRMARDLNVKPAVRRRTSCR